MAARNSKMTAKINIKSENGVLVSEKKLNNAENNISGLFATNTAFTLCSRRSRPPRFRQPWAKRDNREATQGNGIGKRSTPG